MKTDHFQKVSAFDAHVIRQVPMSGIGEALSPNRLLFDTTYSDDFLTSDITESCRIRQFLRVVSHRF
jgi:hypothetical protein